MAHLDLTIPEFSSTESVTEIAEALDVAGCVVLHKMNSPQDIDKIKNELSKEMEGAFYSGEDKPEEFYPAKTRRLVALMARSKSSQAMALDPLVSSLCEHHLGPNCERWQLHVATALEIGPGAREQVLHREEDPYQFFPVPRPNLILATMWAMTDFTKENGATLVVPGSHRWPAGRQAKPEEVLAAEMPKGSVLVWLGGTLHAAGANVSDNWRYGIILTYSLGWLRQEENQYLDMPREVAAELSAEMKGLLGFSMHGALGFYDPTLASNTK